MDFVFFVFLLPIISYIYTVFYVRCRKISERPLRGDSALFFKFAVISAVGLVIRELYSDSPGLLSFVFYMVFALLSGTDILIRKIPTELLAVFCIVSLLLIMHTPGLLPQVLSGAVICCVLFLVRARIGISPYDVIILFPLLIRSGSIGIQLKFISLFLIIWGCAALILQKTQKKEEPVTVPLVPVAALCCFLLQRLISV